MGTNNRTHSELLFEELCKIHGVECQRLTECQFKQPDYKLAFGCQRVVAEVKQIEPNEADNAFDEELRQQGLAYQRRNPDAVAQRVRNLLKKGARQLVSFQDERPGTPGIIVLYDNAHNQYTDPNTIHAAMYGWEQVVVGLTDGRPPEIVERGFGPRNNAAVRQDKHRQLSALATLHDSGTRSSPDERSLSLVFYHNPFATYPFDPQWWHCECVEHLILGEKQEGQCQNWMPWKGPDHGG